jgi:hypothetical protein
MFSMLAVDLSANREYSRRKNLHSDSVCSLSLKHCNPKDSIFGNLRAYLSMFADRSDRPKAGLQPAPVVSANYPRHGPWAPMRIMPAILVFPVLGGEA